MTWVNIYDHLDPVAFEFFGFKAHWYALAYITALLIALYIAQYFVMLEHKKAHKKAAPFFSIDKDMLVSYFFWVEIGILLGARIGYILIYIVPYDESSGYYYLTQPWQMFNPYYNGEFIGIRGMSFHGALIGALIATVLFTYFHKDKGVSFWKIMDLVGLSVPLGYIFGRIGNFLNQELVGRVTDVPWAIRVNGALRHPSQLYEAFLEGLVVFVIIYCVYRYKRSRNLTFCGELASIYLLSYALARFIAEFFREPDSQIGFLLFSLSMGQILSLIMALLALILWLFQIYKPQYFCHQHLTTHSH